MRRALLAFPAILSTLSMLAGSSAPAAWAQPADDTRPSLTAAEEVGSWPMVAANPQRTSWSPEEVRGSLSPLWYRPFQPYIHVKFQIIAASNMLYISTAGGLYALNAETGAIEWVYPTELPLGNSPTIATVNGTSYAFVGGYDKRIHAIEATPSTGTLPTDPTTGYRVNNRVFWVSPEAGSGFETNPLVVSGTVYAGNRDGYFYAFDAASGSRRWRFQTNGPILYSPAYKDGTLYFASNDSYAYAVDCVTGAQVWKSAKLAGEGFYSYWPVVYTEPVSQVDYVVFSGSYNYRFADGTRGLQWSLLDGSGYVCSGSGCPGTEPYAWQTGTQTFDLSAISDYLKQNPHQRTTFIFNRLTGQEYTFDSGRYAPYLWTGVTHSGNKYPPIVGFDGVLYHHTAFERVSNDIPRGRLVGWKFGTPIVSRVGDNRAVDEPMAFSSGGKMIYWNLCCDREAVGFELKPSGGEYHMYYSYLDDLKSKAPHFDINYYGHDYDGWGLYSYYDAVYGGAGINGVYGKHGVQSPPIPYRGKLFMVKANTIMAWSPDGRANTPLATAKRVSADPTTISVGVDLLRSKLEEELTKIIDAGHLRPGYYPQGIASYYFQRCQPLDAGNGDTGHTETDAFADYFHNPADIQLTLARAYPYVSSTLQQQIKAYMQAEYNSYPIPSYAHIGWGGAQRETFDWPPEVVDRLADIGPGTAWWLADPGCDYRMWSYPQDSFYGAWKYAQIFPSQAATIFNSMRSRLEAPFANGRDNAYFQTYPYLLNAYIAGYIGYMELAKLAGDTAEASAKQATLDNLMSLRATTFAKDTPFLGNDPTSGNTKLKNYDRILNVARNFIYLTPELAAYLRSNALTKVQQAMDEYYNVAPYWFVSKFDATAGEGSLNQLYDYYALFQAKAYIQKASREELVKYLDVPAFERGDLFYIQNLVAAIEAPAEGPEPTFADVPFSHPYHDVIEVLYQAGYTAGCDTSPLMYCPEATMNRAESSVFVERGIHTATYDPPTPASQVFADVSLDSWAGKWVNGLWQDQYTAGCGTNPLIYCPWQGHTRAEGCVFYLRMLRGASYEPAQPTQQTFVDVPLDTWFAKWVQAGYDAGLLTACQTTPELRFCPNDPLSRALAAYMMVQAKGLH